MIPMFLTFEGETRTGVMPVQLIANGVVSSQQLSEVESYYPKFDDQCRTSIALQHSLTRTLSDGSQVRFERSLVGDRVFLDPAPVPSNDRLKSPVAWPAFVDLAFSTIFNRPVVDMGSYTPPPYPPEPVYPTPAPYGVPEPTFVPTSVPPTVGLMWWESGSPKADGSYGSVTLMHSTGPEVAAAKAAGNSNIFDGFDAAGGYFILSPPSNISQHFTVGSFPGSSFGTFVYGSGLDKLQSIKNAAIAALQADADAQAAAAAGDNDRYIAYLAALNAWANARNAYYAALYNAWYTTVHQAWVDACKAIDDAYPASNGATILKSLRTSARANQIAELNAWLDTGIASPHLVARYLSFPWTIHTGHTGSFSLPTGTDVGHDQITDATVNYQITYTATNGNVNTVVSETYADFFAQTTMALPSGWKLGGNVAKPTNLFGWLANGDYVRYKRYFPTHYLERAQVRPGDLSSLSFSTAPGYPAFVDSPIGASTNPAAVINSDGFVPPGTVITFAQLEYEVYDPYVLDWVWMPSVDLRNFDAIWIASLGPYTIPALPDAQSAGVSPRNVRVRKVLRQVRQDDWTWSAATVVPNNNLRPGVLPTFPLTSLWSNYPTAVVVAIDLHAGAKPRTEQLSTFPFDATAVFPGMQRDLVGAALGDWASQESLFTLMAKVLNHIYRIA